MQILCGLLTFVSKSAVSLVRLPGTVIFTPLLPFRPVAHLEFPLTMKGGVVILRLGFGWRGNASRQKGPGQSPGGQWTAWPTAVSGW